MSSVRNMAKYRTTAQRLAAWRAYPYRSQYHGDTALPPNWFGTVDTEPTPRPRYEDKPENPARAYHYGGGIGCSIDDHRPFRFVGFCDKVDRHIRHTGWYGNDEGDGHTVMRGVVFRIPARDGRERFLAGYEWGESSRKGFTSGGGMIEYNGRGDVYESAEDAARAANSIAEHAAESEKEYQRNELERLEREEQEREEQERENHAERMELADIPMNGAD